MGRYRSSSDDPFVGLLMLFLTLSVIVIVLAAKLVAAVLGAYVGIYTRHGRPGAPFAWLLWITLLATIAVGCVCVVVPTAQTEEAAVIITPAAVVLTVILGIVAHVRGSKADHIDHYLKW